MCRAVSMRIYRNEIKLGNVKKTNLINDKINKKIDFTVRKCKAKYQNELKNNIVYSNILSDNVIKCLDYNDYSIGCPIKGAQQLVPILHDNMLWITKEKYDENERKYIDDIRKHFRNISFEVFF